MVTTESPVFLMAFVMKDEFDVLKFFISSEIMAGFEIT